MKKFDTVLSWCETSVRLALWTTHTLRAFASWLPAMCALATPFRPVVFIVCSQVVLWLRNTLPVFRWWQGWPI